MPVALVHFATKVLWNEPQYLLTKLTDSFCCFSTMKSSVRGKLVFPQVVLIQKVRGMLGEPVNDRMVDANVSSQVDTKGQQKGPEVILEDSHRSFGKSVGCTFPGVRELWDSHHRDFVAENFMDSSGSIGLLLLYLC